MAKIKDRAAATANVKAELTKDPSVMHPCPKCGKGSKKDHDGDRICSDKGCRHKFKL